MRPRSSLLAAALSLAVCPDLSACISQSDWARIMAEPGFRSEPLMAIVRDVAVPDACKREALSWVSTLLNAQYEHGLCPQGRCGALPEAAAAASRFVLSGEAPLCLPESAPGGGCSLNPAHEEALDRLRAAEPEVARVIDEGVEIILHKISQGRVPYCLLPPPCAQDAGRCRAHLEQLWWRDLAESKGRKEAWLTAGGFGHLLLGDAFTCSAGLQPAGTPTCAIYSAAALLSHYCATPARNPAARDSCEAPEGARCAQAPELIEQARRLGCWRAQVCRTGEECRAAWRRDPTPEERERLRRDLERHNCSRSAAASDRCRELRQRLDPGEAGAHLACMQRVYRHFGFGVERFSPDEEGWARVRRSLRPANPHPVQVDVVAEWAQYRDGGGPHAVVLEGMWSDQRGVERVLLRDSNNPKLVVLPAAAVRSRYFDRGGGGVGVCLPGDRTRCREPEAE